MDDSIDNNDGKPQALRYLHRVINSMPPKKQRLAENESRTQNESIRSQDDNVSVKNPANVKSNTNTEARDAEGVELKPAAKR